MNNSDKVRPKKKLGQHFLTDLRMAERLAALVSGFNVANILEIGPGMGVLTGYLLQIEGRKLKVIEIDDESVLYLRTHLSQLNDRIIEGDFLQFPVHEIYQEPFILCGNYPYNISSQIVFRMIQHRNLIPFMAGMFQLEMARRIASGPGTKDYGIISVITQAFYKVKLEFIIEPGAFNPPPKVRSAVISCVRLDDQPLECDEKLFVEVVKAAFSQRRKMLGNTLSRFNIPKETLSENEFAKLRAENLTVSDFVSLTNFIEIHRK